MARPLSGQRASGWGVAEGVGSGDGVGLGEAVGLGVGLGVAGTVGCGLASGVPPNASQPPPTIAIRRTAAAPIMTVRDRRRSIGLHPSRTGGSPADRC